MQSSEIESFIDTLAAHEPSTQKDEIQRSIDALMGQMAGDNALLQVMQSPHWQKYLDHRRKDDVAAMLSLLTAKDVQPFQMGRIFARIALMLDLRSSSDRTKARIKKTEEDIKHLRDKK